MVAGRTKVLERRNRKPWSSSVGVNHGQAGRALAWFVVIAPTILALLPAGIAPGAAGSGQADPAEQALGTIRACLSRLPPPWPEAWQREYVDTVREVIGSHQDAAQYAARLEIVRKGFPPYWESLQKGRERSLFEVHRAEIRWYVESLMSADLPGPDKRQKLRDQYRALMDYAAASLLTQFPFLDPNAVQTAKADYLGECYRNIESPLLPIFLHPLSEDQVGQLKERWHALRYARVDLWRQLGGGRKESGARGDAPSGKTHPDYLLTQRSLGQLRGQLWSLVAPPPNYYRSAVTRDVEAQKQRFRSMSEARIQEGRLGGAVVQTEYLSFLLAALLETSKDPEKGVDE